MPTTVEQSYQWLLNCWRIMPVTLEESCQPLLNNRASDCWRIIPVTVEESCQPLLHNCTSDWWTIVAVTVEESCQRLLNNRARDSSTSKCPRDNTCSEMSFRVSSYHIKSSQLITTGDKLASFSMVRFLLTCIYKQSVNYVRKWFSVETCALQKPVNWFAM